MAQLKTSTVHGDLNVTGEVNASTKITVNGKEVWDTGNLLNIGTTAATARTALGLGAGATRWPTFTEVTGKPATYAPSAHTHPVSQVTGLGTAATKDVGTGSGNVMPVGAFGLGGRELNNNLEGQSYLAYYRPENLPNDYPAGAYEYGAMLSIAHIYSGSSADIVITHANDPRIHFRPSRIAPWREILQTGNLQQTTGTSTDFPMSQKAVTDALNTFIGEGGDTDRIGLIDYAYEAKDYHIVAFGGEFNRVDYPKLWAYLLANPSLAKTETDWQTESTTNGGICGFFSDGDGSTTFRVPNLDKAFLRPDGRGVGSFQEGQVEAHAHTVNAADNNYHGSQIGPNHGSGGYYHGNIPWTGSTGGDETRPRNIAVLPLIVAK